jgi:hypothetical protein
VALKEIELRLEQRIDAPRSERRKRKQDQQDEKRDPGACAIRSHGDSFREVKRALRSNPLAFQGIKE